MLPVVETLIRACIQCKCSMSVRIRSLALFHQINANLPDKESHDATMVAAAALKCAARYEEEDLDYDSIVLIFYCLVNGTLDVPSRRSPEFFAMLKSLIVMDNIACRVLNYVFSSELAHEFLLHFLTFMLERNYHLSEYHTRIVDTCVSFANDAYADPLSIAFKPDHLAVACLHASLQVHGLLKRLWLIEPWFQAFCHDLSIQQLRRIKCFLFHLYKDECERDCWKLNVD